MFAKSLSLKCLWIKVGELSQCTFLHFCDTRTTELPLSFFCWKVWGMAVVTSPGWKCFEHSFGLGNPQMFCPADVVQWFDIIKFHLSPQRSIWSMGRLCGRCEERQISVSEHLVLLRLWLAVHNRRGRWFRPEAYQAISMVKTMWSCIGTATEMHLERHNPLQTGTDISISWHF